MSDNNQRNESKLVVWRKLSKEQESKIFVMITQRRPFQLGFKIPYKKAKLFLWTRALVKQLIFQKFHVELFDCDIVNFLKRWGFPKLDRDNKKLDQCQKNIRVWLNINLEAIIARSKNENIKIFWLGDIGLVGANSKVIDEQKRLTIIPVIENQGRLHWLTIREKFTPERQVMLLNSLIGQSKTKIFLIRKTDTHFKTKLVKDWLNANKTAIEIFPPLDAAIESTT